MLGFNFTSIDDSHRSCTQVSCNLIRWYKVLYQSFLVFKTQCYTQGILFGFIPLCIPDSSINLLQGRAWRFVFSFRALHKHYSFFAIEPIIGGSVGIPRIMIVSIIESISALFLAPFTKIFFFRCRANHWRECWDIPNYDRLD
jgi:hypothetical protein